MKRLLKMSKLKALNITRTADLRYSIGAHVSAANGIQNAVKNSQNIGGNAFALFLKNQRRWVSPPLKKADIEAFKNFCKKDDYDPLHHILPHGSYLINLANPDSEKWKQAFDGFLDDLQRCEQLGIGLYNLHPGSTLGSDKAESIQRIAKGINSAISHTKFVKIVLENMAGHGNIIGSKLEDLADIIALVEDKSRVGVCIDTCHSFAAGYDLSKKDTFDEFWNQFSEKIGYKYLSGLHLNDSKAPFDSKRDLHQNIGVGFLGLECFRLIVNKPELQNIPMILETPVDDESRETEIRADEIKLVEWLIGKDSEDEDFKLKASELADKGKSDRLEHQSKADKKKATDKKKTTKKRKLA